MRGEPCLEQGGSQHCWEPLGLDAPAGKLVAVRRCVWCGLEQERAYGKRSARWKTTAVGA